MASSNKRPHLALETPDTTESSEESSGASGQDSDMEEGGEEELVQAPNNEIQVEFQARTPEHCDINHGLYRLLKQLFRPHSNVDVGAIAELIVNQRNLGSVITQGADDEDSDDEDDDDEGSQVFGVATIVPLGTGKPLAASIKEYLCEVVNKTDPKAATVIQTLKSAENSVGLIVSERIVNIPPQISVPLYETLYHEVKKNKAKNVPGFNFSHYVMLSRMIVPTADDSPGAIKPPASWVNAEEEVMEERADVLANVTLATDAPSISHDTSEFLETAKMVVFSADKFEPILQSIREAFPIH